MCVKYKNTYCCEYPILFIESFITSDNVNVTVHVSLHFTLFIIVTYLVDVLNKKIATSYMCVHWFCYHLLRIYTCDYITTQAWSHRINVYTLFRFELFLLSWILMSLISIIIKNFSIFLACKMTRWYAYVAKMTH